MIAKVHEVLLAPDGTMRVVYSDEIVQMFPELGRVQINRASHVEPSADGRWYADLAPVGGPKLGPFALRADALAAELKWLLAHDTPIPTKGGGR